MIIARLFDKNTSEYIMGMKKDSLSKLKYDIETLFREPESLLIIVEGMNPFLYVDFNIVLENEKEEKEEYKMKKVQVEVQYIKTNKNTGKQYKKWEWIGWTVLPDFTKIAHKIKGKWAIVERLDGKLERYDLSCIVGD